MKKEDWKKLASEKNDRDISQLKEMRNNLTREKDTAISSLDEKIADAEFLKEAIEKLK